MTKERQPLVLAALLTVMTAITMVVAETEPEADPEAQTPVTVEKADSLFAEQDWAGAAEAYGTIAKNDPEKADVWLKLGRALHAQEKYPDAAEAFEKALKAGYKPENTVEFLVAKSYAADGATGLALQWLGRLVEDGKGFYLPVKNATEFDSLKGNSAFRGVLESLKPCNTAAFRQFDFWVGEWEVTSAANPGWTSTNRISVTQDGCAVRERYTSASGYTGTSLSFFDADEGRWHQKWIDNQGAPLHLAGELKKGKMVLIDDSDEKNLQRVTWERLKEGQVRQHWESSTDGGETWSTVFDGNYKKIVEGEETKD